MLLVSKKKVNNLSLDRVLLEKRIADLCSKIGFDKNYKFRLVYLTYNIDKTSLLWDEWFDLHVDILMYNNSVLELYEKINLTGLSLPRLFLI